MWINLLQYSHICGASPVGPNLNGNSSQRCLLHVDNTHAIPNVTSLKFRTNLKYNHIYTLYIIVTIHPYYKQFWLMVHTGLSISPDLCSFGCEISSRAVFTQRSLSDVTLDQSKVRSDKVCVNTLNRIGKPDR